MQDVQTLKMPKQKDRTRQTKSVHGAGSNSGSALDNLQARLKAINERRRLEELQLSEVLGYNEEEEAQTVSDQHLMTDFGLRTQNACDEIDGEEKKIYRSMQTDDDRSEPMIPESLREVHSSSRAQTAELQKFTFQSAPEIQETQKLGGS